MRRQAMVRPDSERTRSEVLRVIWFTGTGGQLIMLATNLPARSCRNNLPRRIKSGRRKRKPDNNLARARKTRQESPPRRYGSIETPLLTNTADKPITSTPPAEPRLAGGPPYPKARSTAPHITSAGPSVPRNLHADAARRRCSSAGIPGPCAKSFEINDK